MTTWGYGLLVVFVALGLGPASWRKAGRIAFLVSVLVIGAAFAQYHALR